MWDDFKKLWVIIGGVARAFLMFKIFMYGTVYANWLLLLMNENMFWPGYAAHRLEENLHWLSLIF